MSHSRRQGGWRGRGGHRKGNRTSDFEDKSKRARQDSEINEDDPIVKAFRGYQVEMDAKNDRYERIMKINRDITIDSKRLIFLLQRVNRSEDCEGLLVEAEEKMHELHNTKFRALAKELMGQDIYQFLKAFSGGLQEYIEAVTFYHYLANQKLVGVDAIQSQLKFNSIDDPKDKGDDQSVNQTVQSSIEKMTDLTKFDVENVVGELNSSKAESQSKVSLSHKSSNSSTESPAVTTEDSQGSKDISKDQEDEIKLKIDVPIPPTEYILGVADFTGELMRLAINSVGSGDLDTPKVIADMMRVIHDAFSTFSNTSRELRRKTNVLRQSLAKVERACYTLQVRGSEIPKHMLADVFTSSSIPSESFMTEEADYTSD